jgi:hypothetical protein
VGGGGGTLVGLRSVVGAGGISRGGSAVGDAGFVGPDWLVAKKAGMLEVGDSERIMAWVGRVKVCMVDIEITVAVRVDGREAAEVADGVGEGLMGTERYLMDAIAPMKKSRRTNPPPAALLNAFPLFLILPLLLSSKSWSNFWRPWRRSLFLPMSFCRYDMTIVMQ